jgi:hypothetical protein
VRSLFLGLCLFGLGVGLLGATADVPFELGRPAAEWGMFGVDLAWPSSSANPAASAFRPPWQLSSTFSSLYGLVQVWAVSLGGRGFGGELILLDSSGIGPGLSYQVWALGAGAGWRWGSLGLGGRVRILRPTRPKPSWGGALDLGLFWAGPLTFGLLAESVLSHSPYPGEPWPADLSLALASSHELWGVPWFFGAAMTDLFTLPTWALASAVELGAFSLRAGLRPSALALGGGVRFRAFALDWAFTLHPDLPLSFRVSFLLRWP